MFAASIASKAAAGFWSQNAQIAHAANAVIPTTFPVFSFFFLGLKLSLVLVSDSSPRWTDDDDTIDLGSVCSYSSRSCFVPKRKKNITNSSRNMSMKKKKTF